MDRKIVKKYRAVSVVELLMALSIVILLAAGAFFGTQHLDTIGKITTCKSKISSLMLKVQSEYAAFKVFPASLAVMKNEDAETVKDPWGNSLNYKTGNDYFYIISNGPNGKAEANVSGPFKSTDKLGGDDIGMCFVVEK